MKGWSRHLRDGCGVAQPIALPSTTGLAEVLAGGREADPKVQFTPTHSLRLNQMESWFSKVWRHVLVAELLHDHRRELAGQLRASASSMHQEAGGRAVIPRDAGWWVRRHVALGLLAACGVIFNSCGASREEPVTPPPVVVQLPPPAQEPFSG